MVRALPDVTLCAVTAINHQLTVRAMQECLKHCSFADAVLISDRPINAPFRVEIMPPFPAPYYYAPFVCRELTKYTSSAFNLLVQYDGYIVTPQAWSDQFYDYDYIGAKWPWYAENRRVGNSGFCLRSKKLLDITAEVPLPPIGQFVDDELICLTMRSELEQKYQVKIANEDVADMFAYERHKPDAPTFGFHGLFNYWRHIDDAELEKIPALLDPFYIGTRGYLELLFHFYGLRKFAPLAAWHHRLREHFGPEKLRPHLLAFVNEAEFIDRVIAAGDAACRIYQPWTKAA